MTDAHQFLISFAQALARMSLYAEGHPARAAAAEVSFRRLRTLQQADPRQSFSFVGREVIYGQHALRELQDWDWAEHLSAAGVQRLEFDAEVGPEEYREFLAEILGRLGLHAAAAAPRMARPARPTPIRFGAIGVRDAASESSIDGEEGTAGSGRWDSRIVDFSEEAEAVQWMHEAVTSGQRLPWSEAELVVASLSTAMHNEREVLLPLLTLKDFDQYTTTHSINVSVLAMGLAEALGLSAREVRAYGVAGLLHDLGKVRVPVDVLRKPGALNEHERRLLNQHPVDGARLILAGSRKHDMCAAVAFEHHIMIDGGGYPQRHTRRDCHHASLLVHACDVFDALRTHRPYRVAWGMASILAYIERRVGAEFHPDVAVPFVRMLRTWEMRQAAASALEEEAVPAAL
ncbi:MAG: hypothetical protein MNPFHGCM_00459 [Gemmatimonadaceae bacterium]|nr:hypothetical protein [Gemmatimonadaceae bacterium]